MTAYLLVVAWARPHIFAEARGIGLVVGAFVAGYLGDLVIGRVAGYHGEIKMLAPCELASRAAEIGERVGAHLKGVLVLRNLPYSFIGAFAFSQSHIGLAEAMVHRLRKAEIDAILAHEAGHAADRSCWRYAWYVWAGTPLVGIGLAALGQMGINALPDAFRFLHYVNWMTPFVGSSFALTRYCRAKERKADLALSSLDDQRAVVSGYYKAAALNSIPLRRSRLARFLSTHPDLADKIDAAAKRGGISSREVTAICDRAAGELAEPPDDCYDLVIEGEEAPLDLVKRSNRLSIIPAALFAIVLTMILFWIASGVLEFSSPGFMILFYAMAPVAILIYVLLRRIVVNVPMEQVRKQIRQKLEDKCAAESNDSMLLIDALFDKEYESRTWQGALLGIRNGEFVLLGEAREKSVSAGSLLDVSRWVCPESVTGKSDAVVIRYEEDGERRRVVVRNLGKPEAGLPRDGRQLLAFVRDMLVNAGAELAPPEKSSLHRFLACVKRGLAALFLVVVGWFLLWMVLKRYDLEMEWLGIYVFVAVCLLGPIARWTAGPARAPATDLAD